MHNKTKNKLLYLKCDSWTSTRSICGFNALFYLFIFLRWTRLPLSSFSRPCYRCRELC